MNPIPTLQKNELNSENFVSVTHKIHDFYREMLTNPSQKIPLIPEVASRLNMSVTTFQTLFKLIYGCSIYQAYLEIKFSYAKYLLHTGHYTIKEVAKMVGYSQSAKFVQKFREREGQTPLKYARKSIKSPSEKKGSQRTVK
jgi:AraC-like DNA-binding protein